VKLQDRLEAGDAALRRITIAGGIQIVENDRLTTHPPSHHTSGVSLRSSSFDSSSRLLTMTLSVASSPIKAEDVDLPFRFKHFGARAIELANGDFGLVGGRYHKASTSGDRHGRLCTRKQHVPLND
jgi:hypothetical protein